jgi:virginiamycin B lyase
VKPLRLTGPVLLLALLASGPLPAVASAGPQFAVGRSLPPAVSLEGQSSRANSIAFGPEENLWFAGSETNYAAPYGIAGSVSPEAKPNEPAAKVLAQDPALEGIAAGPDGNLWITAPEADQILRVTPAGALTTFQLGVAATASAGIKSPSAIVAGPDGALWFTAPSSNAIGRITTEGQVSAYPLTAGSLPRSITVGADGRLWFTEPGAGAIGAITPAGQLTTYPVPNHGADPAGITAGPGGIWFTEGASPFIGLLAPNGEVTEFKAQIAGPIVYGPQGLLWFGSESGIGSISPSGVAGPSFCFGEACTADVVALTLGPGGELWYSYRPVDGRGGGGNAAATETLAGAIGRYVPPKPTVLLARKARVKGGRALIRVFCGGVAEASCGGTLRLKVKGAASGSARFSLRSGETHSVAVRLPGAVRRMLARSGGAEATVATTVGGRSLPSTLCYLAPSRNP